MIWAWLVGKVGKLAAAAIAAVVLVLAVVGPFWLAYRMGWTARDAAAKAEAQSARIETMQQLLAFNDFSNRLAGDYVLRRGQGEIVYRTLKQEVPRVVTIYKSSPDAPAQPLPACVFTRGFVRVWNAARDVPGVLAAGGAGETAEPADSAAAEDLYDAGITQQDVLENHVDNAELTHNDRLQCEAVITWAKALPGGK